MLANRVSIAPGRPTPLGATIVEGGINLAVVSRHAERIFFCLFDARGQREVARLELPGRDGDDIHHGFITGVAAGARYGLRANGPFDPANGHRFDPAKLLVDPYATELDRPFAWHRELAAPREAAIDTAPLVPKAIVSLPEAGASPLAPATPGFIYELAVKPFTVSHPDIPAAIRGTAAALAHPRIVDHLVRLGVDTVELMPLAAWIDERHLPALGLSNGWGYNPVALLAPDPRLAPGGLAEIRRAVAALHDAGIRVLLDIVLNHTGESDAQGATLSLRGLDNALYYRHAPGDPGRLVNDTGCGNTLAVDRPPVLRLAIDALRHWAGRTGVDGFRFDLATMLGRTPQGFSADAPLFAAIAQDPHLSGLTLVAEPWDIGPGGYRLGQFPAGWHEWNDRYRDDVRRFWRDGGGSAGDFATRLAGSSDIFARGGRPSRSVDFVAAHDGLTLRDLVSYAAKDNEANGEGNRDGNSDEISWNNGAEGPTGDAVIEERRMRDARALLATLLVSRGTPMLTAGDEFGRTQHGNNNAYAQDNAVTWLDWRNADESLIDFTAQLVRLRLSHRVLCADRFLTGEGAEEGGLADAVWLTPAGAPMTHGDWAQPSLSVLGLALYAAPEGAVPGDRVCIWINRATTALPGSPPPPRPGFAWRLAADSSRGRADLHEVLDDGALLLPARAVVVLVEAAGSARSRSRKPDDALIGRLAAAAGIQPDWWQLDGTHHRVSPETQRALLAALRLPIDTAQAASEAVAAIECEKAARPLPVTQLLAADTAGTLRLALNANAGDRPLALRLEQEDGNSQLLQFASSDVAEVGRVTIRGDAIRHLAVPLPALPPGYHRAVLDGNREAACRLIVSPPACFLDDAIASGARRYGLTSHLYALRHRQDSGIGDFETLAQFCEAAARAGGSVAGINPLHHLFPTDRRRASPYQPSDRRFVDPIYIDLAGLVGFIDSPGARAALQENEAAAAKLRGLAYVDYPAVWNSKRAVLSAAFADFFASPTTPQRRAYEAYKRAGGEALRQHAVFEALADSIGSVDRARWPAEWRRPGSRAVADFAAVNAASVEFRVWLQWIADCQLAAAAVRAEQAGLASGIYGDLALGTAADGGEIWARPELFAAGVSLGAPPDPFARDGQVWHLPPFDPHALRRDSYGSFAAILAANMRHAGMLRIDHILGYVRQFWVPQGAAGRHGAYVDFPLDELIAVTAIESHRARCTVIGEDLGTVPEGLRQRLADARVLSYRVLWFEKDGERFRPPASYPPLSVGCLSSHDLPTFVGWRHGRDIDIGREIGRLTEEDAVARLTERQREEASLGHAIARAGIAAGASDADLMAAAHELLAQTPSALVFVQADDLWAETEPLNLPGTDRERPNWRRRQRGPVGELPNCGLTRRVVAAVRRGRGMKD